MLLVATATKTSNLKHVTKVDFLNSHTGLYNAELRHMLY